MKVTTEIRAGNMLDDAIQNFENLDDQVIGFVTTAEQQAQGLIETTGEAANDAWQNLVTILGSL